MVVKVYNQETTLWIYIQKVYDKNREARLDFAEKHLSAEFWKNTYLDK